MSYFLLYFKATLSRYELDIDEQQALESPSMNGGFKKINNVDFENLSSSKIPIHNKFFWKKKGGSSHFTNFIIIKSKTVLPFISLKP